MDENPFAAVTSGVRYVLISESRFKSKEGTQFKPVRILQLKQNPSQVRRKKLVEFAESIDPIQLTIHSEVRHKIAVL